MDFKNKLLSEIKATVKEPFTDKSLCKKLKLYTTFEKRVTADALTELVKDGELIKISGGKFCLAADARLIGGVLRGNRRGFAFLVRDDGGADMFIPHKSLKGAMHKDRVLAEHVRGTADEAAVVSVVERGIGSLVGTFSCERNGSGFVVPDDGDYYSDIYVPAAKKNGARNGDKVVVRILNYDGRNPDGAVIERLGRADTVEGDTCSIIRSYGFFESFPTAVLEAAEKSAASVGDSDFKNRVDFSKLLTITIDGDDARDFDDAISVEKIGGGYKLYVHIADVSHFVVQNGIVDGEAIKRATSVYLPNMVLPMLPESLSNGVCSLVENEKRLTLSVVMTFDGNGTLTDNEIVESYIVSNRRMTYSNVSKILSGDEKLKKQYSDVASMLDVAVELAGLLHKVRTARGSINLPGRESKITLDKKNNVLSVEPYPYDTSNGLIEEFMLKANETVAEFMFHTELPFVYRVHEKPSNEKLEIFRQFAGLFGYNFPVRQNVYPMQFQSLLKEIEGKPEESIIAKVMLRSMQKAKYATENLGHFGLAADYYCHFTSPIRRYPDLMIHRVIKAMLRGKINGAALSEYAAACQRAAVVSSEREIAAEQAERDADDYFKMLFMKDKVGNVYDGYISGVTSFGIFVELDNTVEGFVSIENLPKGKYEFSQERYMLQGAGKRYTLGDKVKVKVIGTDKDLRRVNFVLYEKE